MQQIAISVIISIVFLVFAIGAFSVAENERKARRKAEKELQEARENEAKLHEAAQIKEDANSGSVDADFKYMADKLHEYAQE